MLDFISYNRFTTFIDRLITVQKLYSSSTYVDNSPNEAEQYNVTSIPLVIVEKDGVVVERFQGLTSKVAYKNAINEAIG